MKALVAYYSESGNTEKLAKAIYDGIDVSKKEIMPISEATAMDFDVIFAQSLGHGGSKCRRTS